MKGVFTKIEGGGSRQYSNLTEFYGGAAELAFVVILHVEMSILSSHDSVVWFLYSSILLVCHVSLAKRSILYGILHNVSWKLQGFVCLVPLFLVGPG